MDGGKERRARRADGFCGAAGMARSAMNGAISARVVAAGRLGGASPLLARRTGIAYEAVTRDEEATISKVRYLHGTCCRICGGHKWESRASYPGRSDDLPKSATGAERGREELSEVGRCHSRRRPRRLKGGTWRTASRRRVRARCGNGSSGDSGVGCWGPGGTWSGHAARRASGIGRTADESGAGADGSGR